MEFQGEFYLDSSANPGRALICRVPGFDSMPGDLPISAIQLTFATATGTTLATLDTNTCAKFFGTKHASDSRYCARYLVIIQKQQ